MRLPEITAARAVFDRVLIVEFAGGESRRYDIVESELWRGGGRVN